MNPEGTQSVDRAMGVLVLVSKAGDAGVSLSDVVADSGLKQPTAHRILHALANARLIEQDAATRRYCLGHEAYVLGLVASGRFATYRVAQGSVARVAYLSEDTAFLTVRRGNFAVCIHREEGTYPIRAHIWPVGDRHPLGVGSGSIAMLAGLPDAEAQAVIEANTPLYRRHYPDVRPEVVRDLVSQTRRQGYCSHKGLGFPGIGGIGIGVNDGLGATHAALSIGVVESRLTPDRHAMLVKLLQDEGARIARQVAQISAASLKQGADQPSHG
jgi:DNA-binding IclR family transcriptional regulator